jgi:hypothetical protein
LFGYLTDINAKKSHSPNITSENAGVMTIAWLAGVSQGRAPVRLVPWYRRYLYEKKQDVGG